jgi:hypothetical protein
MAEVNDTTTGAAAAEDLDVFGGVFDDNGLINEPTQAAASGSDTIEGGDTTPAGGAGDTQPGGEGADSTPGAAGDDTQPAGAGEEPPLTAKAIADAIKEGMKPTDTTPAAGSADAFDITQYLGEELQPGEDGYVEQQQALFNFQRANDRMDVSERFARIGPDKDIVDDAKVWALKKMNEDADFAQRIVFSRDPYADAITAYKTEKKLDAIGDTDTTEFEEFRAWKKAKAEAEALGAGDGSTASKPDGSTEGKPAAASAAAKPAPQTPTSIADTPAAGKGGTHHQPSGPGTAFDGVFSS